MDENNHVMEFEIEDLKHLKNYLRFALTYVREQLDRETSVEMAEVEREELYNIQEMYVCISNFINFFG